MKTILVTGSAGFIGSNLVLRLLVRVTALLDEHVMEIDTNTCRFLSNDLVRINDGPFKDITGRVARIAGQRRVVITIKGLQSGLTTAYIPSYCLEKVENEESD